MADVGEQRERFAKEWDTWRWRASTAVAFNSLALRLGWGREVGAALPGSFAELIRKRVERVLTESPCVENGYAWQTFLGRLPPGEVGFPFFARAAEYSRLRVGLRRLRVECRDVESCLAGLAAESVDFFGLSNVLELSGVRRGEALLNKVERTAAEGAVVCLRGILPGGLRALPERLGRLRWDEVASREAERRDRGVVCNFFRIYRG